MPCPMIRTLEFSGDDTAGSSQDAWDARGADDSAADACRERVVLTTRKRGEVVVQACRAHGL